MSLLKKEVIEKINAAYDAAKTAYDTVKTARDTVKTARDAAKTARDAAKTARDADGAAEAELEKAKAELEKAETAYDAVKTAFEDAEKKVKGLREITREITNIIRTCKLDPTEVSEEESNSYWKKLGISVGTGAVSAAALVGAHWYGVGVVAFVNKSAFLASILAALPAFIPPISAIAVVAAVATAVVAGLAFYLHHKEVHTKTVGFFKDTLSKISEKLPCNASNSSKP